MSEIERRPSTRRGVVLSTMVLLGALLSACTDPISPSDDSFTEPVFDLSPTPLGMAVAANADACALRANGAVECWGENDFGAAPVYVEGTAGWFTHVDVSDLHSCGVLNRGVIRCWGSNYSGQAPDSMVAGAGTFVRVAAGGDHTCGVRSDGALQCWGATSGYGLPSVKVPATGSYVAATAGLFHTCALRSDGVVNCWGNGQFDQAPAERSSRNASPFVSVSSDNDFTCAVRADGVAECWGANAHIAADSIRAPSASNFTQVSAGLTHACGLRADGAIECWGENGHNEAPSLWTAPTGSFTHVAAGNHFTCAATSTGSVACVGALSAPVPAAPGSLTATPSSNRIVLTWPNVTGETSYELMRRNTNPDNSFTGWTTLRVLPRDVGTFTDSTVAVGAERYQYRVRACAAGGCSANALSLTIYPYEAPAAPPSVLGTAVRGGVIDVSWTDGAGIEDRFEIERRVLNDSTGVWGPFLPLVSAPGATSTYRDSTAARARRHRYRVRACNPTGCSAFTAGNALLAETAGTMPATIGGTPLSATQIEVTWSQSSNVVWYEMQRRTQTGASTYTAWEPRGSLSPTAAATQAWTDSTLAANTVYQFRVRACTTVGCSDFATSVRIRTSAS